MPRAEGDELLDGRFHPCAVELGKDVVQLLRRALGAGGERREEEGEGEEGGSHAAHRSNES